MDKEQELDLNIAIEKAIELLQLKKDIKRELALEGIATCIVETKTCKLQIKIKQY